MTIALHYFGFQEKPSFGPTRSCSKWVVIMLLCICSLIPIILFIPLWTSSHVFHNYCLPLLRVWHGAMHSFTQPVLFCLVNVVILFIWVSSGSHYISACDPMKEEELQPLSASTKPTSQKCSSSYKASPVVEFSSSCLLKHHACNSKELSHFGVPPASRDWVQLKTSPIQSDSKDEVTVSASETLCADPQEYRASHIVLENFTCRKECSPERSKSKSNKATQTAGEEKKAVPNSGACAARGRPNKFEKRSSSYTNVPSRLAVRNMSMSKAEEIVMEKDELNERIEAFFARFREQLRRESLSNGML